MSALSPQQFRSYQVEDWGSSVDVTLTERGSVAETNAFRGANARDDARAWAEEWMKR